MNNFPNRLSRRTRTSRAPRIAPTWNFKASGSYDAACGIRISPVLRHQSGVNFARTLVAAGGAGGRRQHGRRDVYADPANANREDNIWVFDVRAEKSFSSVRASACA